MVLHTVETDKKKSRYAIDWASIKREYETGQLSVRGIARQYNTNHSSINERIKRFGWERSPAVTKIVRQQIKERLIVDPDDGKSTDQVEVARQTQIDIAVKRGVEVVRDHQNFLGKLRHISYQLADRLDRYLENPQTFDKEKEPFTGGKTGGESVSDVVLRLSQAAAKWIPAERRAYNLDEDFAGESYEDVLMVLLKGVKQ